MKLSTLFLIYAVSSAVTCLGMILLPEFWVVFWGAKVDTLSAEPVRMIGTFAGGNAVAAWLGRNAEPSPSRTAMAWGFTVANGLAVGVTAWGSLSGVNGKMGFFAAAYCALFVVGFAVVGLAKRNGRLAK
jgi:hypothetical protein